MVEGQAVAVGRTFRSPLAGRECIYFRFQVQEKRQRHAGPHGGGAYWKTVIDDAQASPCVLDDGTNSAAISLQAAELVLHPGEEERSGFLNNARPELQETLQQQYNYRPLASSSTALSTTPRRASKRGTPCLFWEPRGRLRTKVGSSSARTVCCSSPTWGWPGCGLPIATLRSAGGACCCWSSLRRERRSSQCPDTRSRPVKGSSTCKEHGFAGESS